MVIRLFIHGPVMGYLEDRVARAILRLHEVVVADEALVLDDEVADDDEVVVPPCRQDERSLYQDRARTVAMVSSSVRMHRVNVKTVTRTHHGVCRVISRVPTPDRPDLVIS